MNGGTKLHDEPDSSLELDGIGGIYRGAKEGTHAAPTIRQQGDVVKAGNGTSVVAVPVTFAKKKPHVTVSSGGLDLAAPKIPTAKVARNSGYGSGSCDETTNGLCHAAEATADDPQVATVGTSAEAPKVSHIGVSLVSGHRKVHGHTVIGHAVDVTAPTIRTTHSTHLTFSYDATILGSRSNPNVYRGSHRLSLCRVHGLTATNPSCVFKESVAHGGGATKGDLTIVLITIKPNSLLWRAPNPDAAVTNPVSSRASKLRCFAAGRTRNAGAGRWTCTGVPCTIDTAVSLLSCACRTGPAASRT